MSSTASRVLRISLAVLVLSGYLALIATPAYPPFILVIPVVLLVLSPVGERLDERTSIYRHLTTAVAFFYGLAMVAVALQLGLLTAVTWLVMFIEGYKLIHTKRQGDYQQIFLMAFFMLICGCALEPGASIGLVMALMLASAVWCFVILQVRGEADANPSSAIADIVPLERLEHRVPPQRPRFFSRGLVTAIAGLSAGCILLTFGLFVFTPRMEAGILGRGDLGLSRTGLSETVDLAGGGRITLDPSPVMRVEFPDLPDGRYDGEMFWRVTSFDTYQGTQWDCYGVSQSFRDQSAGTKFWSQSTRSVARTPGQGKFKRVAQRIYLDSVESDGLPCLPYVRELTSNSGRIGWDPRSDFTVFSRSQTTSMHYEVVSEVPEYSEDELKSAPADYERMLPRQDHFILTIEHLAPRTAALAEQLTRDADTVYDKVRAIEDWLGGDTFSYSLDVPVLPDKDAIDAFIHDVRSGHCELYATAMALMLRSVGIPARVVSGYRGGEWSPGDRAYIVRRSMAHLWVEVYFIDRGWIPFDPSPAVALPSGGAIASLQRSLSRYVLNAKMMWYRDVVGYEGRIQWAKLKSAALGLVGYEEDPDAESGSPRSTTAWRIPRRPVLLFALLLVMLGLWRTVRNGTRSRARDLTIDQARALNVYRRFRRQVRRLGAECEGRTADEIARELHAAGTADSGTVDEVVGIYNAVRFGRGSMSSEEYRDLTRRVRALKPARS
ncbi:MAG: DUF3488 domain-containing transglutaminase family protein [bacterium]|nr:DUF3488 domain-containing transglutaminase family protein [bacterium]